MAEKKVGEMLMGNKIYVVAHAKVRRYAKCNCACTDHQLEIKDQSNSLHCIAEIFDSPS
jgi:hypothetical protein